MVTVLPLQLYTRVPAPGDSEMADSTDDWFMASEKVTDRLAVVDTPVAELAGTVLVTVGAVSSAVVNEKLVADKATPPASVAVPAMLRV